MEWLLRKQQQFATVTVSCEKVQRWMVTMTVIISKECVKQAEEAQDTVAHGLEDPAGKETKAYSMYPTVNIRKV